MNKLLKIVQKKDLEIGKTYNAIYQGDNHAYGKVNGKRTIRVVDLSPIKYKELYYQYGSMFEEELSGGIVTCGSRSFENDELTEAPDKKDWFIKIAKMTLTEAVSKDFVTIETLKRIFMNQSARYIRKSPITCHNNLGPGYTFTIENPDPNNPYLQSIAVLWENSEKMKEEVRSFYPDAWFMH